MKNFSDAIMAIFIALPFIIMIFAIIYYVCKVCKKKNKRKGSYTSAINQGLPKLR